MIKLIYLQSMICKSKSSGVIYNYLKEVNEYGKRIRTRWVYCFKG